MSLQCSIREKRSNNKVGYVLNHILALLVNKKPGGLNTPDCDLQWLATPDHLPIEAGQVPLELLESPIT